MTYTLVQEKGHHDPDSGTATSDLVLDAPVQAGNFLIAAVGHRASSAAATPTIGKDGASMVQRVIASTTSDGGNKGVALFDLLPAVGGEQTFETPYYWQSLWVAEFSGTTPDWVDGDSGHSGSSSVTSFGLQATSTGTDSLGIASAFHREGGLNDGSKGSFDSGYGVNEIAYRGSYYGLEQHLVSWQFDVSGVSSPVTWTHGDPHQVAMVLGHWQAAGYTISGTVTEGGNPVSGAKVAVIAGGELQSIETTDANGDWSALVPSGLAAHAFAYHDDGVDLYTSEGRPYIEEA